MPCVATTRKAVCLYNTNTSYRQYGSASADLQDRARGQFNTILRSWWYCCSYPIQKVPPTAGLGYTFSQLDEKLDDKLIKLDDKLDEKRNDKLDDELVEKLDEELDEKLYDG